MSQNLPTDPKERKDYPLASGLLDYFTAALSEVAHVSKVGNDQHNPGQEMHWAREKSKDHHDCIIRHLADRGTLDKDGLRHTAKVAWRALALLQEELEAAGSPVSRASKFPDPVPAVEVVRKADPRPVKWPVGTKLRLQRRISDYAGMGAIAVVTKDYIYPDAYVYVHWDPANRQKDGGYFQDYFEVVPVPEVLYRKGQKMTLKPKTRTFSAKAGTIVEVRSDYYVGDKYMDVDFHSDSTQVSGNYLAADFVPYTKDAKLVRLKLDHAPAVEGVMSNASLVASSRLTRGEQRATWSFDKVYEVAVPAKMDDPMIVVRDAQGNVGRADYRRFEAVP